MTYYNQYRLNYHIDLPELTTYSNANEFSAYRPSVIQSENVNKYPYFEGGGTYYKTDIGNPFELYTGVVYNPMNEQVHAPLITPAGLFNANISLTNNLRDRQLSIYGGVSDIAREFEKRNNSIEARNRGISLEKYERLINEHEKTNFTPDVKRSTLNKEYVNEAPNPTPAIYGSNNALKLDVLKNDLIMYEEEQENALDEAENIRAKEDHSEDSDINFQHRFIDNFVASNGYNVKTYNRGFHQYNSLKRESGNIYEETKPITQNEAVRRYMSSNLEVAKPPSDDSVSEYETITSTEYADANN